MMKKNIRFLAVLLCLALLLGMSACTTPPESTNPTTAPTTLPAPTEPQALELYQAAAEKVEARKALSAQVTLTEDMTVGGETYTTVTRQTVSFTGRDTEDLLVSVEDETEYKLFTTSSTLLYADGQVYLQFDGDNFITAMDQADLLAGFVPVLPLTAGLYASVAAEETADGTTLTFSAPTALETWLAPEEAEMAEAGGTVSLDGNGALLESTYTASYTYGPAEFRTTAQVTICADAPAEITPPESADGYTALESLDALYLADRAYCLMKQTRSIDSHVSSSIMSQAAGVISNYSMDINACPEGTKMMYQVEQNHYLVDYSSGGAETRFKLKEVFRDGKFTSVVDDGEPATAAVTAKQMKDYTQGLLEEGFLSHEYISGATATALNGLYLLEFTATDELGALMSHVVCENLFNDPNLLDGLASEYTTDTMEFYVALDAYTLLPTAAGYQFEGAHTIDGTSYVLTRQYDQSYYLASPDSYKAITEELAPETQPENTPTPLFYHVTGPDGQEMWLLGTIHAGDARTAFLPQEIYDAFDAADALAVEIDIHAFDKLAEEDESIQEEISGAYFLSNGTTTKDHVSDSELYDYALKLIKATGSYNFNSLYMRPGVWSEIIDMYGTDHTYGLSRDKGVDERLLTRAEDQGKTILEVEEHRPHFALLSDLSEATQEFFLAQSASCDPWQNQLAVQELFEQWCAGDEAALREQFIDDTSEMTEEELAAYEEYYYAIATSRDVNMLNVAKEYLESGDTVFYAVGLAHLLESGGLVEGLRAAGYTVELVKYQ